MQIVFINMRYIKESKLHRQKAKKMWNMEQIISCLYRQLFLYGVVPYPDQTEFQVKRMSFNLW